MKKKANNRKKLILVCSILVLLILVLVAGAWVLVSALMKAEKEKEIAEKLQDQFDEKIEILEDIQKDGSLEDFKFVLSNRLTSDPEENYYFISDLDENGTNELFLGKKEDVGFVIYNIFTGIREGDLYSVYNGDGLVLLEDNIFITQYDYLLWYQLQEEPDLLQAYDEDGKAIEGEVTYTIEKAWTYLEAELVLTDFPEQPVLKELVLSAIE